MGDSNAFDPDNDHLWARCKAHEASKKAPKRCIFVEDCAECEQNCLHDNAFEIHELLG